MSLRPWEQELAAHDAAELLQGAQQKVVCAALATVPPSATVALKAAQVLGLGVAE